LTELLRFPDLDNQLDRDMRGIRSLPPIGASSRLGELTVDMKPLGLTGRTWSTLWTHQMEC
jgi:hypothetical protein